MSTVVIQFNSHTSSYHLSSKRTSLYLQADQAIIFHFLIITNGERCKSSARQPAIPQITGWTNNTESQIVMLGQIKKKCFLHENYKTP